MAIGLFDDDDDRPDQDSSARHPESAESEPKRYGDPKSPLEDTHLLEFIPDTPSETVRKTGLAWSAGIVLFSSVLFLMLLGWFADLLLGTTPWGILGGIVIGSVIGFLQFFRLTSRILRGPDPAPHINAPENDDDR
ncbi:MAG: AtpZ/AtpI family protein [Pyrinomonadaceae bacterium]